MFQHLSHSPFNTLYATRSDYDKGFCVIWFIIRNGQFKDCKMIWMLASMAYSFLEQTTRILYVAKLANNKAAPDAYIEQTASPGPTTC